MSWKNGDPVWEGHYRNNGNNQYSLVSETSNQYQFIHKTRGHGTIIGYKPEPMGGNPIGCSYFEYPQICTTNGQVYTCNLCGTPGTFGNWLPTWFYWYDYAILTGKRVLKQTTSNRYGPDGITKVQDITKYYYDNLNHLFPTRIETSTSTGDTRLKKVSYPQDMVNDGKDPTGIYASMVTANMISPSIEIVESKNSTLLLESTTKYDYWGGSNWSTTATNLIVPRTIDTKTKDQVNYETRMRYYSYDDKGNPTTVLKENDVKKAYLWGYNKTYPVAEIIGADYTTASSYITQSVLDNPANDGSLRSHLNNLRNIPGVLVNTYTYKPLVGMTSQTDPNNRIAYYSYDAFNRLQLIKDQDGKIIKKICYNYAGQQEDCSVNVSPVWAATGNLRCATSGGVNTGYQEREERDNNANSATFNQTQWVSNGYNTAACPLPAAPCSFTTGSGFGLITSGSSSSAGVASFYIVFYPSSAMNPGNSYLVATVNGGCKPTTTRTISYSSGGRNWSITIYPSGEMYWYLSPGSTSVSAGSTIGTSTLTYNL